MVVRKETVFFFLWGFVAVTVRMFWEFGKEGDIVLKSHVVSSPCKGKGKRTGQKGIPWVFIYTHFFLLETSQDPRQSSIFVTKSLALAVHSTCPVGIVDVHKLLYREKKEGRWTSESFGFFVFSFLFVSICIYACERNIIILLEFEIFKKKKKPVVLCFMMMMMMMGCSISQVCYEGTYATRRQIQGIFNVVTFFSFCVTVPLSFW